MKAALKSEYRICEYSYVNNHDFVFWEAIKGMFLYFLWKDPLFALKQKNTLKTKACIMRCHLFSCTGS